MRPVDFIEAPRPGTGGRPSDADVAELLLRAATELFEHGQTTKRTIEATERLGDALGVQATVFPRFGEVILRIEEPDGPRHAVVEAAPLGVDMGKVVATGRVIDAVREGRLDAASIRPALLAVGRMEGVSVARFALLAAAGAAALGVIFGGTDPLGLALIALSAGAGACLRRWLETMSHNRFIQPLCAAVVAGAVGVIAVRWQLSPAAQLVAFCPCMILVPGPHLLNGALDLARARIALGSFRIGYACFIIVVICTGLVAGLTLGGVSLPVSQSGAPVPLVYDVLAAGVAVAAFGTFFAMPWRMLPVPMAIGMAAHAARWATIALAGGSVETGALVACLLVGVVATPITDRWRLPFAAFAFASVVSLMPGVFLFRTAGGLVALVGQGAAAPPALLLGVVVDATTALLILLAMAFGLIVPKLLIEHFVPSLVTDGAMRKSATIRA